MIYKIFKQLTSVGCDVRAAGRFSFCFTRHSRGHVPALVYEGSIGQSITDYRAQHPQSVFALNKEPI